MDFFKAEESTINQEIARFQQDLSDRVDQVDKVSLYFSLIEERCVDQSNEKCIALHDSYKLKDAELKRQRFKLFNSFEQECGTLLHHTRNWTDPIPIKTKEQLEAARIYMKCFRSYIPKLLAGATDELELKTHAVKQLDPMAPSKK